MNLKEKVAKCNALKEKYSNEYSENRGSEAVITEREYLTLRREILDSVNQNIARRKSIPLSELRLKVNNIKKPIPLETGIRSLDNALVPLEDMHKNKIGGFPLGNLINIVGAKGAGKTTIMMKLISNFGEYSPVSWFNFEMSDRQVVEKIAKFKAKEENILYYNSSRDIGDIADEIKFLSADGVKHFVIDSNMKIRTTKTQDEVRKHSIVSDILKELTSTLDINIYLINQISQYAEQHGLMQLKGGNDAEYDSDMVLYILKGILKDEVGKPILDEAGNTQEDDSCRYIKCGKNRIYDSNLFMIKVPKNEIVPIEISYESYEMPKI